MKPLFIAMTIAYIIWMSFPDDSAIGMFSLFISVFSFLWIVSIQMVRWIESAESQTNY